MHEHGKGRERRREKIPSRLHAVSTEPSSGLSPTNREIMTRAETQSQMLNQLSHQRAPLHVLLILICHRCGGVILSYLTIAQYSTVWRDLILLSHSLTVEPFGYFQLFAISKQYQSHCLPPLTPLCVRVRGSEDLWGKSLRSDFRTNLCI